jgi:hypothetical protein
MNDFCDELTGKIRKPTMIGFAKGKVFGRE